MKKTNFKMIEKLDKEFKPEVRGIVSMSEICKINNALCLDEMNELELQNLRDFAVMYFDAKVIMLFESAQSKMAMDEQDKMSAIVTVIDKKIINLKAKEWLSGND